MEQLIRTMMTLIASEVCEKSIEREKISLSDDELLRLYKLSKAHDLAHLVGDALIKNDLIQNEKIEAKFQTQLMLAVYRYEKLNYELERLKETLNAAGIPFLPLKGSVIRPLYPEPWMRTSCDIDILVHEADLEHAVKTISEKLSYVAGTKGSHDVGLFSDTGIHLELHYSLIEEAVVGTMDAPLCSVWENVVRLEDSSECVLSDEMFYYYHIAHMAKHFVGTGGCGVRPFIDVWVLNHFTPYDNKKRTALLEQGGLLTFARDVELLSEVWFGECEHTDITRRMQEYLLSGGVYGTTENRVSVQQVRKGGKLRYALSRIWLPYESLKFHYPSLDGKRFLLPFYEVRRWCRLIFCGGMKRSVNELKINSSTTSEAQIKTKEMLSMLELDR